MNTKIFKLGFGALAAVVALGSCNKEPDESNLYTFTGETIETFIEKDSTLSSFNYILNRVGLEIGRAHV